MCICLYKHQQLFKASKIFHDARPWELISNWYPLIVTVPDLFDHDNEGMTKSVQEMAAVPVGSGPTRTFVVVVAGNGSWDGRGLHFFKSWHDMLTAACGAPRRPDFASDSLQYMSRAGTPFRTLNHIEELGLEVSTNGGTVDDAYPNWFHHTLDPSMSNFLAEGVTMYTNPPRLEDIPAMAVATMAITKFANNPRFCQANSKGVQFISTPVQIEIDLTAEGRSVGSVIATVQVRSAPVNVMTTEQMDGTMTEEGDQVLPLRFPT